MATKVFISQPMTGRTDRDIFDERSEIVKVTDDYLGEFVEIVDSFDPRVSNGRSRLWNLGRAIQLMGQANLAVFAPGWDTARGCGIEHAVCCTYDIPILYLYRDENGMHVCKDDIFKEDDETC